MVNIFGFFQGNPEIYILGAPLICSISFRRSSGQAVRFNLFSANAQTRATKKDFRCHPSRNLNWVFYFCFCKKGYGCKSRERRKEVRSKK